jgi:hypothetical protein
MNKFYNELNEVLLDISDILKRGYNEEIEYINKELLKLKSHPIQENEYIPNYIPIINDSCDINKVLKEKLINVYFNYLFCKSIVKNKDKINNNLTDKQINFVIKANKTLDLLINEILILENNKEKEYIYYRK